MSIHLPSPRSRRAALALLAASAVLTACGGGDSASSATAGGSALVVKGSMSSTARAAASTPWWQRAIAWIAPRAAQAQVATAGSPVSMVLTLHSLQISANADCTGPYVTVQTFSPAREVDLASNPTLFEGSPPAGTYRCLIFEADDILAVRPDAAAAAAFPGRCVAGTTHATDLYRVTDTLFYRRPDGSEIAPLGSRVAPTRQRVFFFATTDPGVATARPNGPRTTQTLLLSAALVVPGQTTFYLDATNGLLGGTEDGVNFCVVEAGVMGFR